MVAGPRGQPRGREGGGGLTFGGGSSGCIRIRRNPADMEVYKIVATLVGLYEIALVDATRECTVTGQLVPAAEGADLQLAEARVEAG